MPFPLTEEQRAIVEDNGGEILVSAAAGSGKTRVLVERLLDRVTREGADIDRFLVITYTKAAAAELRTRIAQELSERLAEAPQNRHLRRQTTLVYQAQISTIHSFCSMLLRECGHLLDLEADFRLADEGEAAILMRQTLELLLDKKYETIQQDAAFAQLVDTLGAGRDDHQLTEIVLDIAGRVQSHPDPAKWLREQRTIWELEGVTDLAETLWGSVLLRDVRRQAKWCQLQLKEALRLAVEDELLEQNYATVLAESLNGVDDFLSAESWDDAVSFLPIPFGKVGLKRKRKKVLTPREEERAAWMTERVRALRTASKKSMEEVAVQLQDPSAVLLEEFALSRPAVQALMDLVLEFQNAYAMEKRRRSLLDFSDLEHFAVQLLLNEAQEPTELAKSWSKRYDEIMVDEYQDTNQVQNAIFFAISEGGKKLFQVGDVKQSIYRFRLADPTIFLEKYRRFAEGDQAEEGAPRKRVLSRNFRSRPQVLEGCNDLFRAIMSQEFGELDYTDDQALVPAASFPEGENYALELDALDLSFLGEQEGEKTNKDRLEARFVAHRIRQLLEQPFFITEGEEQRPIRPSDIMILLRSPGSVLHHYIRALEEEGVPWASDGEADLFSTTEVNVALAILQIVDNPHQDIPLIAALRSPVYGFTADQLALLRGEQTGDFYTAILQAAEQGDQACRDFLNHLAQLRMDAGDKTCRQLIWHIYEQTNLLGIVGAMPEGKERQNHLLSFYALAGRMEDAGCRTLFQFLLRLERLRKYGSKLPVPASGAESEGVSLLSIHRSKGLERPVVFVGGLTREINRKDLMRPVLFHPVLGVGPKGLDRERMVEYTTLARRAVASQLEREMMAEELRLLYVAMTRAKEKLILVLTLTDGPKTLERLRNQLSVPVSPLVLEQQRSVGQWVLLHALTRPEAQHIRDLAEIPALPAGTFGPNWDMRWINGLFFLEQGEIKTVSAAQGQEILEETDLLERLRWVYPYQEYIEVPSKITATQQRQEALREELSDWVSPVSHEELEGTAIYRPQFMVEKTGLTASQRGTALHLAMQYLPRTGGHSVPELRSELERLVQEGFLTAQQKEVVPLKRIAAFYASPLGQAVSKAEQCHREFKFSLLRPVRPEVPEEQQLLQGMIDTWFEDENGITILDFKSDRIQPGEELRKAEEYRPQLEVYREALSALLGRPVAHMVLWFFATSTAVEL